MLISFEEIKNVLLSKNIEVHGSFHIGAHECEEMGFYNKLGIQKENVVWIDAIPSKVAEACMKGIPNVYAAVITDKDDEDVVFNVSNNVQSSSVLEFGTHSKEHPSVVYLSKFTSKSITIDTFFQRNGLDASKYDFWNFDIQGAELLALKGAAAHIHNADVLYLEVNIKELYKNCALMNEIDAYLSDYGFKRVITELTQFGWGDALYLIQS